MDSFYSAYLERRRKESFANFEEARERFSRKYDEERVMLERAKEVLERWRKRGFNDRGQFIPSNKPTAVALRHKPAPSMFEIVREAVRSQRLADEANAEGFDTFEEANDFDVEDDPEPRSKYERPFEEMRPGELTRRRRAAEREARRLAAREREALRQRDAGEGSEPAGERGRRGAARGESPVGDAPDEPEAS